MLKLYYVQDTLLACLSPKIRDSRLLTVLRAGAEAAAVRGQVEEAQRATGLNYKDHNLGKRVFLAYTYIVLYIYICVNGPPAWLPS